MEKCQKQLDHQRVTLGRAIVLVIVPIVLFQRERLGDRFQFRRLSSFEMHGYSMEKVAVTYIETSPIEICGIIFTR